MATKKATKKAAKKAAKKATRKAATKRAPARKAATKKTAARKAPAKKTAAKKAATRKPAARKAPARKPAGKQAAAKKKITPRKALSNTRKLLEAKQQHARETPPWQQLGTPGAPGHEGYQSPEAKAKANELHAGESRMEGIHGSISTHDRHAQGRRDNKS